MVVYTAEGLPFPLICKKNVDKLNARWYDLRNGEVTDIGLVPNHRQEFPLLQDLKYFEGFFDRSICNTLLSGAF
jgi:hypothetical protein